jgi:L-ascorbate metabolism protein UlaG (beta-lactamase superfamily)
MIDRFTWFKQSAYLWRGDGLTVYIDPWGVTTPDPADVVVITHAHFDHFDLDDIEKIKTPDTMFVAPPDVAKELSGNVTVVRPGDSLQAGGVKGRVVPAYNTVEERLESHPQANGWVGYVLTLGDHTYYHAGDTDHLPELSDIKADVTFLPVSGTPFTMDPAEAGGLARAIAPALAVPMHYGYVAQAGTLSNAERFVQEAAPVKVEILKAQQPFDFE